MAATIVRRLLVVCAILALPVAASGQEATLSGTVIDSTGRSPARCDAHSRARNLGKHLWPPPQNLWVIEAVGERSSCLSFFF